LGGANTSNGRGEGGGAAAGEAAEVEGEEGVQELAQFAGLGGGQLEAGIGGPIALGEGLGDLFGAGGEGQIGGVRGQAQLAEELELEGEDVPGWGGWAQRS